MPEGNELRALCRDACTRTKCKCDCLFVLPDMEMYCAVPHSFFSGVIVRVEAMNAQERMIRLYDRALASEDYRDYFDGSGFYNFGYWGGPAKTQREASEALVDVLTDRIERKGGRILDVACGPGATTQRLTRSYEPAGITAINISEKQLAAARQRVPGCTFCAWTPRGSVFPASISTR